MKAKGAGSPKEGDIAKANIRTKSGQLYDISENSLVKQGIHSLTDEQFFELFKKYRLRFNLTPQCNLWCVFCSNEGLNYTAKCHKSMDIDLAIKLSDILLKNTGLQAIDFSGGEPTIHEDFLSGNFKLVKWTRKYPNVRFSIHSNGIMLTPMVIDEIKDGFSKIGVSIHSVNFKSWNKISNLKSFYPLKVQKSKFKKLMGNLEYLSNKGLGDKVFLKSVVVRGYNDSEEELKEFLDFCVKYKFHPKFFEFEPQYKEQEKYVVGRKELFSKLEKIGCLFSADTPRHNNPDTYIPGVNFEYRAKEGAKLGLHSIFGCGDRAACETCYIYLCLFVKPTEDGKGIYLKPCTAMDTRFDLTWALRQGDVKQVLNIFKLSREYLMLAPGMGIDGSNKEQEFKIDFT